MAGVIWVGILLVLSLAVLVLEMFIPSGGVLSIVSAIGFLTSVVLAFREGSEFGFAYLVGLAIGLPLVLWGMIKYWPYTTIGRMMLNLPPPGTEPEPTYNPLTELIGKRGTAKSKMLPSGAVVIDGRTYDALADGIAVEEGACVEVFRVEGSRITVRACSPNEPAESGIGQGHDASVDLPTDQTSDGQPDTKIKSDQPGNILDRTYDDVLGDPFDEST